MNSQKNVLQVLVSDFTGPATGAGAATLDGLPVGELAFYDEENNRATVGTGRFVLNNGGELIQSNTISGFTGWGDIKSYAAPVLHEETVTVVNATPGAYYQLQVILDIKGMTGKYIMHGVYTAKTGDDVTAIAAALVSSLNAAIAREGNTSITVSSALGVITVVGALQTYIPGKKLGNQVPFTVGLTSPETDAAVGTVTVPGSDGVGAGNYVNSKEFFAWGNQDAFRYSSWRNNFTPKTLSDPAKTYDVLGVNKDEYQKTANADVRTSLQILVAFNSAGSTPAV